ncbi:MAG: four-carbon acid sugar kinase family protein [Spirochaetes bacterium]|nr:four-carbon acid sugar kinase family protein [Spirochaetota bacterium]
MNPRLFVIADDLTGALDTGVQFARAGVQTKVVTHGHLARLLRLCKEPVLVVDTESRHLPADKAGSRVASCVRSARSRGVDRFYKKTDSTLRGNVGAELTAVVSASGGRELFFVPALPKAGRVTRSGVQFVDGVPLHESSFARDPREPVLGTSIEGIIATQSGMPVVTVGRGENPATVLAGRGRPLIVAFDAETDGDLEAIADRLAIRDMPHLTAGCSGFAAFLPRLHGLPTGGCDRIDIRPPLLVVSGSLHERSLGQLRHSELRGIPSLEVDPEAVTQSGWRRAATRTIVGQLREHGTMIVRTRPGLAAPPPTAETLLRGIGCLVRRIISSTAVSTIALFGGDTAFAVVEALGIWGLDPVGEICQGVVVCRAKGSRDLGVRNLVTKAGGFGPVDVVDRIVGALEQEA